MSIAFWLLVALIALSPGFLLFDGPLAQGVLATSVALLAATTALAIKAGEAGHVARLARPVIILSAAPALWIVIQIVPMPVPGLAHPIWSTARAAVTTPAFGHISIDPGATLIALIDYITAVAIYFVAAALTIDRQRAETTLSWLIAISTLYALVVIVHDSAGQTFLGELSSNRRSVAMAIAALGLTLAAAGVVRTIERFETRRDGATLPKLRLVERLAMSLAAFLACGFAIVYFAPMPVTVAAGFGAGVFVMIVVVRRLGVETWITAAAAAIALLGLVVLAANQPSDRTTNTTLRFSQASERHLETAQRILADGGLLGSGAGTFAALEAIYRGPDESRAMRAPTTAATIEAELGRPAVWIAAAMGLSIATLLFHGALRRGRDSFYAGAAAGCTVTLMIEAFCDISLLCTAAAVLAMVILGLGTAQSAGRTIQ